MWSLCGFQNDLYSSSGDLSKKLPHERLPSRMKMYLWILNEKDIRLCGR